MNKKYQSPITEILAIHSEHPFAYSENFADGQFDNDPTEKPMPYQGEEDGEGDAKALLPLPGYNPWTIWDD